MLFRSLVFGSVLTITVSTACWAQGVEFKRYGKIIRRLQLVELQKLVPVRKVKVIEPHESVEREYQGFSLNELLTIVYGKKWHADEEVLFTCSDGYQPSIPVSRFHKYKAYLMFKRSDSDQFLVQNKLQNNEMVPLGPFYLVWDNLNDAYLKMMGANGWPYQVTTIDLVKFSDRFPKMAPPPVSPVSVKHGFENFRQFCMSCHMINGEGGVKAMDLNVPKSVTEYHDDAWLKKWIAAPTSIRPETKMPALNPALPGRNQIISDIISYLKAMAQSRK